MYQREDQYRSARQQMRSARRARQRAVYRRRRLLALLMVMVGVMAVVFAQTGVSLPSILPGNEDLARGGSSGAGGTAGEPGPAAVPSAGEPGPADVPSAGETVLSAERSTPTPRPEETTEEAREVTAVGQDRDEPQDDGASEKPEDPPPAPPPASGEPLNVLILGVDRRPSEDEGAPSRSDTMMLAQVSPGSGAVELLSVPRDLLVEVEPGVEDRINTAYAYGGVEQAKAAMEGVTGVPIDAHAIIDFKGFEEVIDAVGGVQLDVGSGQFPEKWHMGEGKQRLGGRKALFFARYRGTAGGDLDRIERQQQLLAALRGKMLRWNTVTRLPSVLGIVNANVDTDLGLIQAISLGRALVLRGGNGDLTAVQLKGRPETLPGGAEVLVPDYEANEEILQSFRE